MSSQSHHRHERLGTCLVLLATLAFSSAGVFTKSVSADAWSVIFWRGVAAIAFIATYLVCTGTLRRELRDFGWPAVLATLCMAVGTAAFISAFKLTSVANVSMIWATVPFVSAALAWVSIREAPTPRVLLCSALALLGVLITVRGSWAPQSGLGDTLAFVMTLMMAATMVLYRAFPRTPTKLPAALASLLLLPVAMVVASPLETSPKEIGILAVFGLVFAAASVLLMEGALRVSSAKAALVSALETPLAPLWAAIVLAEQPAAATLLGGAVIMTAVFYAQGTGPSGLIRRRRAQSTASAAVAAHRHGRRS